MKHISNVCLFSLSFHDYSYQYSSRFLSSQYIYYTLICHLIKGLQNKVMEGKRLQDPIYTWHHGSWVSSRVYMQGMATGIYCHGTFQSVLVILRQKHKQLCHRRSKVSLGPPLPFNFHQFAKYLHQATVDDPKMSFVKNCM